MQYRENKAKTQRKPLNAERPCIVCNVPHRNNQPFCSQGCCEKYKATKRA